MSKIDLSFDENVEEVVDFSKKEDDLLDVSSDISLDFEGLDEPVEIVKEEKSNDYVVEKEYSLEKLPEAERKAVLDFVDKIDLNKTTSVLSYGQKSQKKVESITSAVTQETRTKDSGLVGDSLIKLVSELQGLDQEEEEKGILGIFKPKRLKNRVETYKIKFKSVESNIDSIVEDLDNHKIKLIRDIHNLDNLYEVNKEHFKELTLYIAAGEEKLRRFYNEDILKKRAEVEKQNNQILAQELQDMLNQAGRFEQRLHDLKLSRTVCIQFAPQIRVIQNNDTALLEKIQSTINNAIPIWRTNIVIGMGIENSKKAVEAQKAVTDMTNSLLKQNSELLRQSSVEIAKQTQRGLIDLDTIQTINNNLIATLTEVVDIQRNGLEQRKVIESELNNIEENLKNKLIEAADERAKLFQNQ